MTEKELQRMADENICYEIKMLITAEGLLNELQLIMRPGQGYLLITLMNARLESFLIHARNFMEFFYPTKSSKDQPNSVLAIHYLSNWENLDAIKDKKPKTFSKYHNKIHQRLAHISLERLEGEKTRWLCKEILTDVLKVWKIFLTELSKESQEKRKWFECWDDFIQNLPEDKKKLLEATP